MLREIEKVICKILLGIFYLAMSLVVGAGVAGGIMYLHEQLQRTGTILLGD